MNVEFDPDASDWEGEDLREIVSGGIPKALDSFAMGDLYFFLVSDLMYKYREDSAVDTSFIVKTDENGDWVSLEHFALHPSLFSDEIPDSLRQGYERIFQDYFEQFPDKFEVEFRRDLEDGFSLNELRLLSDGGAENFQRRSENLSFLIECIDLSNEKLAANSFGVHLAESCRQLIKDLDKFAIRAPQLDEDLDVPIRYIEEDDWDGEAPEEPTN
jgi:hypothetical protein